MSKSILLLVLISFFVSFSAKCLPPAPPPPPEPPNNCWPPPCNPIPVDQGLLFVIAAGAFLGARKIYKINNEDV